MKIIKWIGFPVRLAIGVPLYTLVFLAFALVDPEMLPRVWHSFWNNWCLLEEGCI